MTTPTTPFATPPAQPSPPVRESRARPPVDPVIHEAFEQALARSPKQAPDDELLTQAPGMPGPPPGQPLEPPPMPRPGIEPAMRPSDAALVFVSSQWVTAAPTRPPDEGTTPRPAGVEARPTPAVLGSALSALSMPASPDGVQHWQFSFSQPGSALSGVALTAHHDAPWQLQLQLPAHARDRSALDARLGELRQRLAGRGAHIGDIELHTTHDPFDSAERR